MSKANGCPAHPDGFHYWTELGWRYYVLLTPRCKCGAWI